MAGLMAFILLNALLATLLPATPTADKRTWKARKWAAIASGLFVVALVGAGFFL